MFFDDYKNQIETRTRWVQEEFSDKFIFSHSFDDYVREVGEKNIIQYAFEWNKSECGFDFWDNFSVKWRLELHKSNLT